MRKARKITALLMALTLIFSLSISALAQEEFQLSSIEMEMPSSWALENVQWAAIYELAPEHMFEEFTSNVTRGELYEIYINLYEILAEKEIMSAYNDVEEDRQAIAVFESYKAGILKELYNFSLENATTRLEMTTALYNLIKAAIPELETDVEIDLTFEDVASIPQGSIEAVKYMVYNGVLNGRANNKLDLFVPPTRQELMVFTKVAYEFIIYETGRDSKGMFWEIKDGDKTLYLLGSVHVANSSMYPLSRKMLSAFEKSDILVVEADISNMEDGVSYMQQKMFYTDGSTLYENVPQELYERFVEIAEAFGLPVEMYSILKPWYAGMFVQSLQLLENDYSSGLGIDLFFLTHAGEEKEIQEIEGMKFQVDMFDSFSNELQVEYLTSVLNPNVEYMEEEMELVEQIMHAWKTGDASLLESLLEMQEDMSETDAEFYEKVWTIRNDNMTEKVRTYLADSEDKTYFVVVGAGHLVGENGIVTQLQDEYELKQIK